MLERRGLVSCRDAAPAGLHGTDQCCRVAEQEVRWRHRVDENDHAGLALPSATGSPAPAASKSSPSFETATYACRMAKKLAFSVHARSAKRRSFGSSGSGALVLRPIDRAALAGARRVIVEAN